MARRLRLVVAAIALALIAPAFHAVPIAAAADELDPTFGTGGKVLFDTAADDYAAAAVAIQSDGKIIAVGGTAGFNIVRFTTAGVPDITFDGDGMATIGSGSAAAVAIQSDGKIVVAGSVSLEGQPGYCCRLGLARFNTNGSPDTSFDGDGFARPEFGVHFQAADLALQSDGKIIAVGYGASDTASGVVTARLGTNGTPDASFGSGGMVLTGNGALPSAASIQSDGKVVVGATSAGSDFLTMRYTTSGVLDSTYSGDGLATADFGGTDIANDLVIQPDGKVVLAGWTGSPDFALARFNANGTLDSGFDGDGKVTTSFFGYAIANGVALESDGKIVAVGRTHHDYDSSYAIARYDTDGWLDGKTITDFGDPDDVGVLCPPGRADCSEDIANDVAIQADGKIVVVGGGGPCGGPCLWTLARYLDIPPIKDLAAAPVSINLGTATVSGAPKVASVTVTNTGSTGVAITAFELVAAGLGLSISSETCPVTLAARTSCTVNLSFAPSAAGSLAAELRVHSDAPTTPLVVPVFGTAVLPSSGVVWGTTNQAGPAYTWNGGGAFARTVQSGTQRLHLAYSTDRINGAWARNTGPYVGVYYVRSTSGTTWGTPKRLNPSGQHAAQLGLAAAGSRVYATWVSQTKWVNYSPTAPRALYVRVNKGHGAAADWKSTIRLTSTSGRVDYPTIAASGTDVHIAYTDAVTGSIKVATSRDRGVTWAKTTIGATTLATTSGRTGVPSVAVDGSTVVVAWLSDTAGTIKARVSTDRGVTWGTTVTVGSQSVGSVSAAVLGSRIAVSWATPDDVVVRQRISGTWQAAKVVSSLPTGEPESPYSPQVVLQGSTAIGVSWARQLPGDFVADLKWAESANGSLWFAEQTLASNVGARRSNDWPAVLWPSAGTRYVVWNGWSAFSTNYRIYLRTGTGVPISPAVAAADWQPSSDAVLPWGSIAVDKEHFRGSEAGPTRR